MQSNLQNEHGKNGLYVSISDVRRYSNFHMAKFCKNKYKYIHIIKKNQYF